MKYPNCFLYLFIVCLTLCPTSRRTKEENSKNKRTHANMNNANMNDFLKVAAHPSYYFCCCLFILLFLMSIIAIRKELT